MIRKNKNIPHLLRALKKEYPDVVCELHFKAPHELLVATILSAQCTDKRVNMVTPALFKKYSTVKSLAGASPLEVETLIRSTGFYRNKTKNILGMARQLMEKHKGQVPGTMDALLALPGVARKTANVVLGVAFGIADGIVVDTHVMRLSQRLGLTTEKTPEKIEKDLMKKVPKENWIWLSHALIAHGRRVCMARNPQCVACPVRSQCANPVNV
jgi:endonuclease III